MTEKKILISIIVGTLLILGGSVVALSNNSASASIIANQNVKVVFDEDKFDWGDIQYSGPKAIKTFKIKNNGTENLRLGKIKTSCTCTTAQLIIDGKESPLFSMHGIADWIGEVLPSKEAELKVVFDQTFHGPSGVGPIERFINVETNDASRSQLEFLLKGNVVKS